MHSEWYGAGPGYKGRMYVRSWTDGADGTHAVSVNMPHTEHETRLLYGLLLMWHRKAKMFQIIDQAPGVLSSLVLSQQQTSTFADVLHTNDELHAQERI